MRSRRPEALGRAHGALWSEKAQLWRLSMGGNAEWISTECLQNRDEGRESPAFAAACSHLLHQCLVSQGSPPEVATLTPHAVNALAVSVAGGENLQAHFLFECSAEESPYAVLLPAGRGRQLFNGGCAPSR